MTMLARLEQSHASTDRWSAQRLSLALAVPGECLDEPRANVIIHDLSHSGLLIETSAELPVGARLAVDLPEAEATAAVVMWQDGHYFGCRFDQPIPVRTLSAARLMSPAEQPRGAPLEDMTEPAEDCGRLPSAAQLRVIGALALGAWGVVLTPLVAAKFIF